MTDRQLHGIGHGNARLNGCIAIDQDNACAGLLGRCWVGDFFFELAFPAAKVGFSQLTCLIHRDISHNDQSGNVGLPIGLVEGLAVFECHRVDGGFCDQFACGVVGAVKKRTRHIAADASRVVALVFQTGDELVLQLIKRRRREGGLSRYFSCNAEQLIGVLAQTAGVDARGTGAQACTDVVHRFVQAGFVAQGGAFGQEVPRQGRYAGDFALIQLTGIHRKAHGDAREFVVFHDQHRHAVFQRELGVGSNGGNAGFCRARSNASVQLCRCRESSQGRKGEDNTFHYSTEGLALGLGK